MDENHNVLSVLHFKADAYKLFPLSGVAVLALMSTVYPELLRDDIGKFQVAFMLLIWIAVPLILWRHYKSRKIVLTSKSISLKNDDRIIKQVVCSAITKIKTVYSKDHLLLIYASSANPSMVVEQSKVTDRNEYLKLISLLCENVSPTTILELDSFFSAYSMAQERSQQLETARDRVKEIRE